MAGNSEWKALREEHDAAWTRYLEAAERVHASFEKMDGDLIQQQPADQDRGELETAWNRLADVRRRMDELMAQRGQ